MGSVTAIFLVPFLAIFGIIIGFFETLIGTGTEKVTLPYDAANGIVWEYKEGEEAFIDCIKTTTKNNQQLFTFRGKWDLDKNNPSSYQNEIFVDDIYFEDANGNLKKYYAIVDFRWDEFNDSLIYGNMDIYDESECAVFQYTVKAITETEDFYWHEYDYDAGTDRNRYVGLPDLVNIHERTYHFVLTPEDIADDTFDMSFHYRNSTGKTLEKITVTFEMVGKEVTITDETHYVLDENGNFIEAT